MLDKRGELTSEQLIALILVAAGFVIVLAFFTQLGTKEYTSNELCKFSVLSRATAEELKSGTGEFLPLQCTTDKICIVASKDGKCKQFAGEKEVSYVYLPAFNQEKENSVTTAANVIARVNAESLYSCWNMMGQGKLDLFNTVTDSYFPDSDKKSICTICTRIAIADDVPQYVVARVNVREYMRVNTVGNTEQTYLKALSGDDSTNTYTKINENLILSEENKENKGKDLEGFTKNPNETAVVFMQFKPADISDTLKNQLQLEAGIVGSAFAIAPTQVIRFAIKGSNIVYSLGAAGVAAGVGAHGAYQQQKTAATIGYCGSLTSKEKATEGCSLVQTINYDVEDIRTLCGSLQSNP